jgi:SAM-dependent methyltransferase
VTWRILLVLGFALCVALGFAFRDHQYRLDAKHMEADQSVLDHRDSAYTSMTWVASETGNYLQLRFFDKVEGGICLHPTWQELVALKDPRLAHLVPDAEPAMAPPAASWTYPWTPDPGTVSNSPYVRLFPLCVLLNDKLCAAAGGDPRAAKPRILVVGLGSGAGIAVLAHHFPEAAITVVDIDRKVVQIVRDHFPLIHWLETRKRSDGEPRLQFAIGDARQFIHFHGVHGGTKYDAVILDAYTAGSTIPPHLMTREFFSDCAAVLDDDGIVLANVIGSFGLQPYTGEKHRVLGGAIRTFRAAGLSSSIDFPVLSQWESSGSFNWEDTRNNIVVSCRKPLEPKGRDDARWKRVLDFQLFPEPPTGKYMTRRYWLSRRDDKDWGTAMVDAAIVEKDNPGIVSKLELRETKLHGVNFRVGADTQAISQAQQAVAQWAKSSHGGKLPLNWDERADQLVLMEIDCVQYARDTYYTAVSTVLSNIQTTFGADRLVGDKDYPDETHGPDDASIPDAPIFTDQRPNADILNH